MAAKVLGEEEKPMLDFEETELRLGLPGGGGRVKADHDTNSINMAENKINVNGKRDFSETVDLKLNLSSKQMEMNPTDNNIKTTNNVNKNSVKPLAAKAQVVGWPPVRSFRKNILAASQKNSGAEDQESENKQATVGNGGAAAFVKVSMDGAPYLRKVDLNTYKSYQQLSDALAKMFSSFTIGNCEVQGMKDFMNKSKLMDLLNSSDYVPTYEDKDGDWMLVGDVPWEMFVESCKRLSIMRGTEAIGLAPRAMEKCKNRS